MSISKVNIGKYSTGLCIFKSIHLYMIPKMFFTILSLHHFRMCLWLWLEKWVVIIQVEWDVTRVSSTAHAR